MVLFALQAIAGGGMVLEDDVCKIKIGFYDAHITTYQPETSGNTTFCGDLPDAGKTIFVLDYLHASMKEVPLDFRIIRDDTGLGRFVRWEDVVALGDLEKHTIYYHAPSVEVDASLTVEPTLPDAGRYIGIVTAGHPTNDTIYTAVFPFEVGRIATRFVFPILAFLAPALSILIVSRIRVRRLREA